MTASSSRDEEEEELSGETVASAMDDRFHAVFHEQFGYVARSLRRLGVVPRDLEDMAQEVFLTVHVRWGDYDPSRPIRPWLFAFCFRVAANYRRLARHRYEVEPEAAGDVPASERDAEDELHRAEGRALVIAALDAMDFERRSLVVMHDLEGFTVPEIEALTSVPRKTIYSRLRAARDEFVSIARKLQKRRGQR